MEEAVLLSTGYSVFVTLLVKLINQRDHYRQAYKMLCIDYYLITGRKPRRDI